VIEVYKHMSAESTLQKPWGTVETVNEGVGYQVKKITIDPGKRTSYKRHRRRSEYWVVVSGEAVFFLDDEPIKRSRGEMAVAKPLAKHRVENSGQEPLVFIEVRLGDDVSEDDVERLADDYGRV